MTDSYSVPLTSDLVPLVNDLYFNFSIPSFIAFELGAG